MGIISRICRR